ncbi:MAG: phosphoglycerate kinase [Patescibacteria group bacterium]
MQYLSHTLPALIRGKTALIRVDFNVENQEESFRLRASLPTFKFLIAANVKIVIISHRGRPRSLRDQKKLSLRSVRLFLERNLGRPVRFISKIGDDTRRKIDAAAPKSIFLIENLRFDPGEETNDPAFAKKLALLGDFFINDAFSVSHRANASVTGLPGLLPSVAGLLLEKELLGLNDFKKNHDDRLVIILGGAKASDKIGVLTHFLARAHRILLGGVPANTFLKASGFDIGTSIVETSMLPATKKLLREKNIVLPVDFVWQSGKMFDVGPRTIAAYQKEIADAKTIFWNGPLGYFERDKFRIGSAAIAKAIVKSEAFSVVGGGETTQLMHALGLTKRVGFLSTGGGAMLEYLSGKTLPGLAALEKTKKLR